MLIGECVGEREVGGLHIVCESRQMVCYRVLDSPLIHDLYIKLLKEKDPPNQAWFGVLLGEQVPKRRMVRVNDNVGPQYVAPKLLQGKDDDQKSLLRGGVILLCFIHCLACIAQNHR